MAKDTLRVIKLKILKPLTPINDFELFGKIVDQLQEEVRISNNKIMTACNIKYSEIVYGADRTEALDGFCKELEGIASTFAPSLDSGNRQRMTQGIFSRYFKTKNSYENEMNEGTGNPPMSFKQKMPIPINRMKDYTHKKGEPKINKPNIKMDECGRCEVKIPLTSTQFNKSWTEEHPDCPIKNVYYTFAIDSSSPYIKGILKKIISGEFDVQSAKLIEEKSGRKSTYYLYVAYKIFVEKAKDLIPERVCGVDLGMKYAAVCAISDLPDKKKFIDGSKIVEHCIKLEERRRKAQRLAKYNNKDGHGRKSKVEFTDQIRHKENNYRSNANRKFAKDIVDFAVENQCGTIHVEDLSGFSFSHSEDRFLKQWAYYQLQDYIIQNAELKGITVKKVNPVNTSRMCSCCGYIDKENRKTQSQFVCIKCGFKANADFNAATNIAKKKPFQTLLK